jgi:ribonuclease J
VFALEPGDRIIFSSRVIPGHEPEVYALTSELLRRGFEVITRLDEPSAHVSGHAARPEQQRMIELVRPRAFLPLHGTLHHLSRHETLAKSLGVPSTCVLEDGDVGELAEGRLTKVGRWPSGRVHVAFGHVVPPEVLRERRSLASGGFAVAVVHLDAEGFIVGNVGLVSRGILGDAEAPVVLLEADRDAKSAVFALSHAARADVATLTATVRLAVRRVLTRATGYKPEVEVAVVRVASIQSVV